MSVQEAIEVHYELSERCESFEQRLSALRATLDDVQASLTGFLGRGMTDLQVLTLKVALAEANVRAGKP